MQEIKVKNVIIGKQYEDSENLQKFIKIAKSKSLSVKTVEAGDKINIEKNLYFNILWPNSKNVIKEKALNNNALVCKLNYNSFTMLFTGDIEEPAEKEILREYKGERLKCGILKVAHHGSKSSTSEEFLDAVSPKIALIGVGKNNLYGHPSNDVVERIENFGAKVYRTDKMGEISICVNKISNNGKYYLKQKIGGSP